MVPHVPNPGGGHDFRVPMQPVSPHEENNDVTALGQLRARRSHAFVIGEAKARQREISADAYLFLYKELVGLAGDRTYCWPGLEFLVERLGTSEGTLKRWMKELEKADLIQRKPRPGGQTSLTYITAYLQLDPRTEPKAWENGNVRGRQEAQAIADIPPVEDLVNRDQGVPSSPSQSVGPAQAPIFFGPEVEIDSDRSAGSGVIPQTFKSQELKSPGGQGGDNHQLAKNMPAAVTESDVVRLLKDEEVHDPDAVIELKDKPIAELEALSGYLDKQTNVQCRPGLFVWLARQDFGAKLLAGRQQHKNQGCKGRRKQPVRTSNNSDRYRSPELEREPVSPELAELWQKVQDQVSLTLPKETFDVWIRPITLVALEDTLAVVATPNVFVRQEIEQVYKAHLEEVLSRVRECPIMIQAVIG